MEDLFFKLIIVPIIGAIFGIIFLATVILFFCLISWHFNMNDILEAFLTSFRLFAIFGALTFTCLGLTLDI